MTSHDTPNPMTIDLEAKLVEIEKWREEIVSSRAQRDRDNEAHRAEMRKWLAETEKTSAEIRYIPKDYTVRVASLVATIVGISASALTAILTTLVLHH